MNPRGRVLIAAASLLASLAVGWATFTKVPAGDDLEAYAFVFIALILALVSSVLLYKMRANLSGKIFCGIAILITAFWVLEFFGGVAWYTADKIARHYQHQ